MRNKYFGLRSALFLIMSSLGIACIGFSAYQLEKNTIEEDVLISKTTTRAVCYNKDTGIKYLSLDAALDKAEKNQSIYVCPNTVLTIEDTINVPSGVSLVIPFDSNENIKSFGQNSSGKNIQINLRNGADFVVNGTLSLGAELGTSGIVGAYSEITLGQGSSITIKDSGVFNCYGKVSEYSGLNGNLAPNVGVYDNSFDSERYVSLEYGAQLLTSMASYDMPSGGDIDKLNGKGICPTYVYDFPCLQTYVWCKFGSVLEAVGYVKTGIGSADAIVEIVNPISSSAQSMFYLSEGEIGIEYCDSSRTNIYLNGSVNLGSLYISSTITIDTSEMFIPISYKYAIYVAGVFNTKSFNIKFLPSSYLEILNGGSFNISSKVIFYLADSLSNFDSSDLVTYGNYCKNMTASKCVNGGSIKVDENGQLGGYIQPKVKENEDKPIIDLSSVRNQSHLSLTSNEGASNSNIKIINASGPFYDDNADASITDCLFKAGSIVEGRNDLLCWDGDRIAIRKISIIIDTKYKHNLYSYSCYSNITNQDTDQTILSENQNSTESANYEIIDGYYFKMIDDSCYSITINGEAYESGSWILVYSDIEIIVIPTESYQIVFSLAGSSGASNVYFLIKYGPAANDLSQEFKQYQKGSLLLPLNYYFTIKPSDWGASGYNAKIDKIIYDSNGNATTQSIMNAKDSKWGDGNDTQCWLLSCDYSFVITNWKMSCLIEGTAVTMADGTYKNVEDIGVGELLRTWDFETGAYSVQPVLVLERSVDTDRYVEIELANGKSIAFSWSQTFFDIEIMDWITIFEDSVEEFIGKKIMIEGTDGPDFTEIIGYKFISSRTNVYEIVTAYDYNYFANNVLTIMPLMPEHSFFKIDSDYAYDPILKQKDIDVYGLYRYEDFADLLSHQQFDMTNVKYWKIAVCKGYCVESRVYDLIDMFLSLDHI